MQPWPKICMVDEGLSLAFEPLAPTARKYSIGLYWAGVLCAQEGEQHGYTPQSPIRFLYYSPCGSRDARPVRRARRGLCSRGCGEHLSRRTQREPAADRRPGEPQPHDHRRRRDRKSTRLNSSHANISYAVFCLKKKKKQPKTSAIPTKKKTK